MSDKPPASGRGVFISAPCIALLFFRAAIDRALPGCYNDGILLFFLQYKIEVLHMKKTYLMQLSRAARWRLPPAEAQDVVADYEELLLQKPRSEPELVQELGTPTQAVQLLCPPRIYRQWLAVFGLLTVCLLLPALSILPHMGGLWRLLKTELRVLPVELIFLAVGLLVSWFWFRRQGVHEKSRALPKGLAPALAFQLAGLAGIWWVIWLALARPDGLMHVFQQAPSLAPILNACLQWGCFALALVGLLGLVNARLSDRRWRSVYVLGLTATVLCMALLGMFWSLDLDASAAGWQLPYLQYDLLLTVAGMTGTVASLC